MSSTEVLPGSSDDRLNLSPGDVLDDKFRIVRRMGAGGMGAVYEITHELTHHRRAMKLLHPQLAQEKVVVDRFLREASAAGRIGNAHIVETFDAGWLTSGEPYLVMEMLEGDTLADLLDQHPSGLPVDTAVKILTQVCDGVQAAHDAGIIHRDLKPENIFIAQREGGPFAKILDFGISKFDNMGTTKLTARGTLLGTPAYMSPEQFEDVENIDGRSDVFSLGVILYELLSGDHPFPANTLGALARKVVECAYAPPSSRRDGLAPRFDALLKKVLVRDRDERIGTPRELAALLVEASGSAARVAVTPEARGLDETALEQDTKPSATLTLTPGGMLTDKIRLDEELGEGGMGQVWIATNLALDAQVAVKLIKACESEDQLRRFKAEARGLAQIKSPHVVRIFDYGVHAEQEPYIVMELLEGKDLREHIEDGGPMDPADVAHVIHQLCSALTSAHEQGVVHRDIKPANIFLTRAGDEMFVKVLDFGVAKFTGPDLSMTSTGALMGTPFYASPEQLIDPKDIDHRADLWSVGVVTYACLTGELPFMADSLGGLAILIHECTYTPPSQVRPSLPAAIDDWMAHVLTPEPDDRFQTASELSRALREALEAPAPSRSETAVALDTTAPVSSKAPGAGLARGWDETEVIAASERDDAHASDGEPVASERSPAPVSVSADAPRSWWPWVAVAGIGAAAVGIYASSSEKAASPANTVASAASTESVASAQVTAEPTSTSSAVAGPSVSVPAPSASAPTTSPASSTMPKTPPRVVPRPPPTPPQPAPDPRRGGEDDWPGAK